MNLSSSGMASLFKQDVVSRQLSRSASSGGKIFDPTSSAQKSNHETDKQAEENATWFFEYKALLNSKLTTLTTALTSAYTTDLDATMARTDPSWNGGATNTGKNAMQGITGSSSGTTGTIIDPGAFRTAWSYLDKFGLAGKVYSNNVLETNNKLWQGDNDEAASSTYTGEMKVNGVTGSMQGTTTFLTGAEMELDALRIDMRDPLVNDFVNTKSTTQLVNPYPPNVAPNKQISNNLELTLYKFFSQPENYDLLRFGMLDNLYIVGTSSLATGSQVQGSLSLRFEAGLTDLSKIRIKQERFSCFFHS